MMNSKTAIAVFMAFVLACLGADPRPKVGPFVPHGAGRFDPSPNPPTPKPESIPKSKTSPKDAKDAAEKFQITTLNGVIINFTNEYSEKDLKNARFTLSTTRPSFRLSLRDYDSKTSTELGAEWRPSETPNDREKLTFVLESIVLVGKHIVAVELSYPLDKTEALLDRFGTPSSKAGELLIWKFPSIPRNRIIVYDSGQCRLRVMAEPVPADEDTEKAKLEAKAKAENKKKQDLGF
jgi:hypothetical protein